MLVAVELELIVRLPGPLRVSCTEDELVRLRLGKKLLDELEPLSCVLIAAPSSWGFAKEISPDRMRHLLLRRSLREWTL